MAGPSTIILQPEVDALKNYVENGGRALFMLDPPLKFAAQEIDENAALMSVLADWGVTPDKDLVLDLAAWASSTASARNCRWSRPTNARHRAAT